MADRSLVILYGSQTGCAKEVAERIEREARRHLFTTSLTYMDAYNKRNLPSEKLVIFVCSTTGQGETPENMKQFWRFLRRKDLPADSLSNLKYAVFGLGDSGYPIYNAVARRLHQRLLNLGASAVQDRGLGDDQHPRGYDGVLDPWLVDLWKSLLETYPLAPGTEIISPKAMVPPTYQVESKTAEPEGVISMDQLPFGEAQNTYVPVMCPLVVNERITSEDHDQDVRHLEFDLSGSGLTYAPGDVLVVHPRNSDEVVKGMLAYADLAPTDVIRISPSPDSSNPWISKAVHVTALDLFQKHLDVQGTPRRYFFEQLAHFTNDERQKEKLEDLSSAESQDELYQYCQREKRTFLEVLEQFDTARPPLEYLVSMIPRLQPRMFSISSALSKHPERAHVTLAVVKFKTPWKRHVVGTCSSFLAGLPPSATAAPSKVGLSVVKGSIGMPKDVKRSVILVGPGTGIAPFRGMCQDRWAQLLASRGQGESLADTAARLGVGSIDVYFGNRYHDKDYLYHQEWAEMASEGVISSINTAFSRDQDHKVYVQDTLRANAERVWAVLSEGGYFVLAGNAKKMPGDVREALADIISTQGKLDDAGTKAFMKQLEAQKRFSMETWA